MSSSMPPPSGPGQPGAQPPLPPPGPAVSGSRGTSHLPPPGAPSHASQPGRPGKPDERGDGLSWKIATGVLAVTTVAGGIWGYTATKDANDTQTQQQQQIDQLHAQMASEESDAAKRASATEAELQKYQARVAELRGSLRVDIQDLRQESQHLRKLQQQYRKAQAAAAQEDASLRDQLNAANSKAALAQHCAAMLAAGLVKIYEDVPDVVTYRVVARVMDQAQAQCDGIVTVSQ